MKSECEPECVGSKHGLKDARKAFPSASLVILIGIGLLLIACQGAAIAPSPSDTPTVTATALHPTDTAGVEATSTPAPSPSPSPSPEPTLTPTESKPTATPLFYNEATPDFMAFSDIRTKESVSPNGEWVAEAITAQGENPTDPMPTLLFYSSLRVRRADNTVTWTLADVWSWAAEGSAIQTTEVGWAEQYYYFSYSGCGGGCCLFGVDIDLYQLDLNDGNVKEWYLPGNWGIAVSPDGTLAAFVSIDNPELIIYNLETAEEQRIALEVDEDYHSAGSIVWAPDGQALMMTIHTGECVGVSAARSIIRIDLAPLTMQTLVDRDSRRLRTGEWTEPDRVLLTGDWGDDTQWWMDVVTGEITQ